MTMIKLIILKKNHFCDIYHVYFNDESANFSLLTRNYFFIEDKLF